MRAPFSCLEGAVGPRAESLACWLPAGVDGAFLRQIATDEKLCMFELLLTRLQARRLTAAVLARDGSGGHAPPHTPSLQTPSASQIEAVRDRVRRLEDVLDLSMANPRDSRVSLDTPAPADPPEPEAASIECVAEGQDEAKRDAAHAAVTDDCNAPDSSKDDWGIEQWGIEQCGKEQSGVAQCGMEPCASPSADAQRATSMSPVSTNSEESVEGELDLLWRGVGSLGGEADLLGGASSAPAHARSQQHHAHIHDLDRRLQLAATRTQRALMNALHATSERDAMRHDLSELSSEFVGSILLRRAAADPSAPRHSFSRSGAGAGENLRKHGQESDPRLANAVHGSQGTRAKGEDQCLGHHVGKTVWVVGGWNGFNLLATSEYLDTRNSQWVRGPSLPKPRRGACSVALDTRLLIFGGWDGWQHLCDADWMDTRCVDYTMLKNPRAWHPLPALPHATCQAAAAAVCRPSGRGASGERTGGRAWDVYVIGGHAAVPSPRVHVLTVVLPDLESPLQEGMAQRGEESAKGMQACGAPGSLLEETGRRRVVGSKASAIMSSASRVRSSVRSSVRSRSPRRSTPARGNPDFIRGQDSKTGSKSGSGNAGSDWEVGEWREVPSLRTARTHHCCAAIDGLILAIGGTDGDKVLRTVECYDTTCPEAGWVPVRPLAHAREGAAAVVSGDSVYVIGGHDGAAHLCSVEVWSPKLHRECTGHWRPVYSLVQPRSGLAAVSVGQALVALGGYCGRGGERMTSCEMWHPKGSDPNKVKALLCALLRVCPCATNGCAMARVASGFAPRSCHRVASGFAPRSCAALAQDACSIQMEHSIWRRACRMPAQPLPWSTPFAAAFAAAF